MITPYTIVDGETVVDESALGNGNQISKVQTSTADSVTVKTWNTEDGANAEANADVQVRYTNLSAAINNSITVKHGFGKNAIKGKSFYIIFKNMSTNKSDEAKVTYTIDKNGAINWTDADGKERLNIVAVASKYIEIPAQTTLSERDGSMGNLKLYYTKKDMLVAYANR